MAESAQQEACTLERLPPDILTRLTVLLPDPAGLAATCRATATRLDQDELLLAWAATWAPRCTRDTLLTQHRHPGYALLHWRRLHCMPTARMAALMLEWVARQAPGDAAACAAAHQLLYAGDALGALQALLPHSEYLLLPYAAQAGHVQLLQELLAAPGVPKQVELCWGYRHRHVVSDLMGSAAHAAARGGHGDAMRLLLGALEKHSGSARTWGLLESVFYGGRASATCVLALAQLREDSVGSVIDCWREWRMGNMAAQLADNLRDDSVTTAVVDLLEERCPGFAVNVQQARYAAALDSGQLDLLPLLRPDDMDNDEAAAAICAACARASSGDAAVLALLPDTLLWIQRKDADDQSACGWRHKQEETFRSLLSRSWCQRTLDAIWAALPVPADRAGVALTIWEALRSEYCKPCTEAVQWVMQHAPTSMLSEEHKAIGQNCHSMAAMSALRRGNTAMLETLQEAAITAQLIADNEDWRQAQRAGQLRIAVREGDVSAVQAAMASMGEEQRTFLGALEDAAALADFDAAEAIVAALAPELEPHGTPSNSADRLYFHLLGSAVLSEHEGRLLAVVCEGCASARELAVGQQAWPGLLYDALARECINAAEWLVRHDSQAPEYLSSMGLTGRGTQDPNYMSSYRPEAAAGLTALLHRLAAPPSAGSNGDAAAAKQPSGSSGAAGHGSAPSSKRPAGARQLTPQFIGRVLDSGYPDLVHALLVYMDSWRVRRAGKE